MTDALDQMFLRHALRFAHLSKDPSTKVGAIIVSPHYLGSNRHVISSGYNSFPRGIADTAERLTDRETKLRLVVHAEMRAVLKAAKNGFAIENCTMYLAATDAITHKVWGGPPCTRCLVEIIEAGITEVVSLPRKTAPSRWAHDLEYAISVINEAGVAYREIEL